MAAPKTTPEADAAAMAAEEEQAVLDYLEMLKVVDPEKYKALMAELAASAPGAWPTVPLLRLWRPFTAAVRCRGQLQAGNARIRWEEGDGLLRPGSR